MSSDLRNASRARRTRGWICSALLSAFPLLGSAFSPVPDKPPVMSAPEAGSGAGASPGGSGTAAPAVPAPTPITPAAALPAAALPPINTEADEPIRQAREAFAKKDKARLAALRSSVMAARHPLASWVEYWELNLRLTEVPLADVDDFLVRWTGHYVEDRLRNDWLLELGRRREWAAFQKELPRFRMSDDREVACYAQIASLQGTRPSAAALEAAQAVWMAQRDTDEGCQLLAQMLVNGKALPEALVWRKINLAVELNRLRLARQTAALLGEPTAKAVSEVLDQPQRHLSRKANGLGNKQSELTALAIARRASNDPAEAAELLKDRWAAVLGRDLGGWAWAVTARQGAQALNEQSLDWVRTAWSQHGRSAAPAWGDETLGWLARAALRLGQGQERWQLALRAINAMSPAERQDPAWQYWRARALQGLAAAGSGGDAQRAEARQILSSLASPLHFYGQLAAEDLGGPAPLPPRAAPITTAERDAARRHAGLHRGLHLIATGLRSEGVREWNYHLIGMSDRELLAAAQLACDREVWDRCINTSEKTRSEINLEQRYPMPLRSEVTARTREIGLDPAYVYGLIRQESRFIMDARSHVGASGLMQVMPATARWTAKKIGMTDFRPEMITERDVNLRIGTAYLKLVLDDQDGAQALAAAAYNAGPGRPRRWRNGPVLEPAIWAENVPFSETRDYVKKVTANATLYASLMSGRPASLKARLGASVGPRDANAPPSTSPSDLP